MVIDSHAHVTTGHPDVLALMEKYDLFLISICVAEGGGTWRSQAEAYSRLARTHPDKFAWCTSFSLPTPVDYAGQAAQSRYTDSVLARLEEDLAEGAVGCKIWKNVGMEIQDHTSRFVMPDHPIFEPIYSYLSDEQCPLVAHTGDPLACWEPLEPDKPHSGYYADHPQWHMYGKEGFPSHAEIIDARDNVLAHHPDLQVIGAHLGSLEHDVREVAQRLDRFPNFHVDFSARLVNLVHQDQDRVHDFFSRYHERILFGTDISYKQDVGSGARDDPSTSTPVYQIAGIDAQYSESFAYLQTDEPVTMLGRTVPGLALPESVLTDVLQDNAARLFRGLPEM